MTPEDATSSAGFESQDTGYSFESSSADAAREVIENCFADDADYLEAARRLHAFSLSSESLSGTGGQETARTELPPALMHELERALMYELEVPFDGPVTCQLGPDDGSSDFAWPPRIRHVTQDVVVLWTYLASRLSAAAGRARFSDLAFRRSVDPVAHSQAARDAYLEFSQAGDRFDLDHAHALIRAWTLDRAFNRAEGEQECRTLMAEALDAAWAAGQRVAGVLLPMLGALCRTSLGSSVDPVGVDSLLERASELYGGASSVTYIADLRRSRARTEAERRRISVQEIETLAEEARSSSGLVRIVRMRDVISRARQLQLIDVSKTLTAELQTFPPSDVDLESIETGVSVSRLVLEPYFRKFTRDRDWRDGFMKFAHLPPPTGSISDLESAAEERLLRPRLIDLVAPVVLDHEMLPEWTPNSTESREEYAKARDATIRAAVVGEHLVEILRRIRKRYGEPPPDEMVALIAFDGRGNTTLAAVFTRALQHFWSDDFEACVHIAVPRIESACRLLLKQLDVGIYQVQLGDRPGMYPPLGVLLDALADQGLDESWLYFLRWLLVDHSGKNFRNGIAHGKVSTVGPSEAALCLRALLLVVMLCGPGNGDDLSADSPGEAAGVRQDDVRPRRELRDRIRRPLMATTAPPNEALVALAAVLGSRSALTARLMQRFRRSRKP